MHDDRTSSLLDAMSVSLSVNNRVDCHLKHHSIRCKSKVHFDTIVLNSSKTSSCCSNVRITMLLHMALKRNVRTINSSKYATGEIIETMFIPSRPPEVSACISTLNCVVRFETECSRGSIISSRLSTILSLHNTNTTVSHTKI